MSLLTITTIFALASVAPRVNAQPLAALRNLAASNAEVSALVVDLDDLSTIGALNPDQRLTPASVSKLFAAAGALEQFGADHRFESDLATDGEVENGTVESNLVFIGGGGPALDSQQIWALVQRLQAAGITRVDGDLIIDDGLFGTVPCLIKDRCDAVTRASKSYSAPLSSAGVNFGTVRVTVSPGDAAGDDSRVVLHPIGLPGYEIDNEVTTGEPGSRATLAVWREYDGERNILHLRGKLPAGGTHYEVRRAVTSAAQQTSRVLATLLADAGIDVNGTARVRALGYSDLDTLARIGSDTLAEQLIPMMAYSNNYMADTLTLDLAADGAYNRPLTLARASQTLEVPAKRAMEKSFPAHAGNGAGPIFDSGSGLAVSNKLSARDVVALLNYMYHQNALFPAFYGSLPVPISAPSRTLKHGNFDWLTRLAAKTGTLSEPVTVRALGGYFRMRDGGFGAFAFIINGTAARPAIGFWDTVGAYQEDLEAILAEY